MAKYHYTYGLFSERKNVCLYVGQTNNPTQRFNSHKLNQKRFKTRFVMTIFNRVRKPIEARRHEAKTIAKYRKLGQARFNLLECRSSLTKTLTRKQAVQFIKKMKTGQSFEFSSVDRTTICSVANMMKEFGMIKFSVVSRRKGENFRVYVI